jgi:mutator protein MutT
MASNGTFHAAVAAAIMNDKNEVILTQRSLQRDHHPGEWEISTGRLMQGESFEQALEREVQEELGISLRMVAPLSTFHFYRGPEKVEHIGINYLCKISAGVPKVDGVEEVAWKWVHLPHAISLVKDESIRRALIDAETYCSNQKLASQSL